MEKSSIKDKSITLYVPYYSPPSNTRVEEIEFCLKKNLENKHISRIVLLVDDGTIPSQLQKKITLFETKKRPTYKLWLELTKKYSNGGISLLANSDIFFDETILLLNRLFVSNNSLAAISRYEFNGVNATLHGKPHWSQDSWAICDDSDIPSGLYEAADIPMGTPRCDNRIAYLFLRYSWSVLNPCKYVRSYHLHNSKYRNYCFETDRTVMGAVAYIHPNLQLDEESEIWIDLWLEKGNQVRNVTLNKSFFDQKSKSKAIFWEQHAKTLWINSGRFIRALSSSRAIYIWGAGEAGRHCLRFLRKVRLNIQGVIDNDQKKHGLYIEGVPIYHPTILQNIASQKQPFVFITSMYVFEIMQQLREIGMTDEVDFMDFWSENQAPGHNDNVSVQVEPSGPSNNIRIITDIQPVLDTNPITVTGQAYHFSNHHFWQYPCATERQAYENHLTIDSGDNVNEGEKEVHTYLGLPWATYIDKKISHLPELDYIAGRVVDLQSQCRKLGYALCVHTVCQHIQWNQISEWFNKLNITDLHLSHCEKNITRDAKRWPYRIHSWPLIAASVESIESSHVARRIIPIEKKKYFATFVGAHMPHYRSNVRLQLQQEFQSNKSTDILFELRDEWHFNTIVFDGQVSGVTLDDDLWADKINGMTAYNDVISDSIFSLCPEGAGPNTLRIWESMALGAIPVIIADDWLPPIAHGSNIGLPECCLFVPANEIEGLQKRLLEKNKGSLQRMQNNATELYKIYKNYRAFAYKEYSR